MRVSSAIIGFVAAVAAHGDHDHDQEPMSGPFNGLWYNTLPGDGGKQVRSSNSKVASLIRSIDLCAGRFNLLRHLHLRSPEVPPLPLQRREVRHCVHWYDSQAPLPADVLVASNKPTGAPFDTGTSYRPGARFGPSGIRQGSRRLNL
jgi:agmatinase